MFGNITKKSSSPVHRYYATYKCPLCGKLLRYGDATEIPYDDLPKLAGMVVKNQMFMSNPALYKAPMHIPCKCDDGSCGLAAFAGFWRLKE